MLLWSLMLLPSLLFLLYKHVRLCLFSTRRQQCSSCDDQLSMGGAEGHVEGQGHSGAGRVQGLDGRGAYE